jgi:hypothetical protein
MKRLILFLGLFLAMPLAACTPEDSGSLGPAPTGVPITPGPSATPPASALPSDPTKTITVQVWFSRGGKVFPTKRTAPYTLETSHLALTQMMIGPSAAEAAVGVDNAMPVGLSFDIKGISNGVATVSFPSRFYADGAALVRLRQAQVVYTLTQYTSVSRVDFQNGSAPLGRADLADLVPAIVVLGPVIGQSVTSPFTVTGTANTREATVNARLLDAAGREIATKFTTATCGNGCRGTYSMSLSYQGCVEQNGTLEVYQISGEDGSRRDVVAIPLVLAAC